MSAEVKRHWTVVALPPPALTKNKWYLSWLIGTIFVVAAILQLIGFNDFSNNLVDLGVHQANFWGAVLIFIELWAAAGFFKIPLSRLFRAFSNFFALAVAGFWFYESILSTSDSNGLSLSANFFGRFLSQAPGWWPVLESAFFLFLVLYIFNESKQERTSRAKVVTKVTRVSGKKERSNV